MQTVVDYLYHHAAQHPEKPAVIANGVVTDYRRLAILSKGYAAYLRGHGLQKGDVVLAKASQSLDYVVVYLGVHTSGGVIAPVERSVPAANLAGIGKAVNARFAVCSAEDAAGLGDLIHLDSVAILENASQTPSLDFSLPDPEDSADILFTTGTTGASKGVEITHAALVATAENVIFGCQYRKNTVVIVPGPLNHAGPIRKLVTTIVNGSTIYILNGMTDINAFYAALAYQGGVIGCCLPPAAIRTLFMLTGDKLGDYATRIDFIESASAPLPEPDKLRLCRLLPQTRLYNNYGTSESASICMYDYSAYPNRLGCIGKVMPHSKMLIVDQDKQVIQSSKEHLGFLACAGDTNMKGYVNAPELTKQVMKNGVVYTNDMGYIDEEGFVYIVGRAGDVINVGGLKVAPAEVEEAALSIDGIEDCICIPVRHPISGYAPKLLVVMREGKDFSPKAIASALQQKLESYKVPVQYEKVERVARTYNGKLDRKAYQN